MKWSTFAIFAFAALVLELSLTGLVEVASIRPSLLALLALFIALSAARVAALWACFLLGCLADLSSAISYPPGQVAHLLGPHALGFTFGGALVLQIRAMVMQRQLVALCVFSGMFVATASIIVVAVYTARSWFPSFAPEFAEFRPAGELMRRWASALYTAIAALPVGYVLLRWQKLWSFQTLSGGSTNWR